MSSVIKIVLLVLSISVLSVYLLPLDGKTIVSFNDSRLMNFSLFWQISNPEIAEKCTSPNQNLYIVGLCNSYYSILIQIHDKKLLSLERKNESKIEELSDFCKKFVSILPSTSSVDLVQDDVKKFKEKYGKEELCERNCKEVNYQGNAELYTIDLCKLVYFGYSELAKSAQVAVPLHALQNNIQGNSSVTQTNELAPEVMPVDLNPVSTKSPAVVNHKVETLIQKVDQKEKELNPEQFKSDEYPKEQQKQELPKKVETVPTAKTVPPLKKETPALVSPAKVTPSVANPKIDEEFDKKDRDMNNKNEQNMEAVVSNLDGEVEEEKTKGTEGNPIGEEENIDENPDNYVEDESMDMDDSIRDNNHDNTVQKIPPRHQPEPEIVERPPGKEPYDDSAESPHKKEVVADPFMDETDSNFFTYFIFIMFACILSYVVYHNKSKILALLLEGRRGNGSRRSGRRKHTAAYRKLDSNLEEALLKNSSKSCNTPEIIY